MHVFPIYVIIFRSYLYFLNFEKWFITRSTCTCSHLFIAIRREFWGQKCCAFLLTALVHLNCQAELLMIFGQIQYQNENRFIKIDYSLALNRLRYLHPITVYLQYDALIHDLYSEFYISSHNLFFFCSSCLIFLFLF